jgi:hypothetical protein
VPHETIDADDRAPGLRGATLAAMRRLVCTRPRRWLVGVTLAAGPAVAVALTATTPPAELTFAMLANPVQSLMSVMVPFVTSLLARDIQRSPGAGRAAPTLLAAVVFGAVTAVCGILACTGSLALAPAGTPADAWRHAGTVAAGSVLVQIVAALVGTGLGLLLRRWAAAFAVSIVLPMGLWLVLGSVEALHPAQPWLAPYASVQHLLSGRMSAPAWAQWLVVVLLWPVALNAAGMARLRRATQHVIG